MKSYGKEQPGSKENVCVNVMTNGHLLEQVRRPILSVCLLKKLEMTINQRNRLWKCYQMMIFIISLKIGLIFGISRYEKRLQE